MRYLSVLNMSKRNDEKDKALYARKRTFAMLILPYI